MKDFEVVKQTQDGSDANCAPCHQNGKPADDILLQLAPVLSISPKKPITKCEDDDVPDEETEELFRAWQKWCQSHSKQEIVAQAEAMMFIPKQDVEEDNTSQEEYTPEEKEKHDSIDTDIAEQATPGDVRAYFTRGLSKLLVQQEPKKPKQPTLVPGSNVSHLEPNPPVMQDPTEGQMSIECDLMVPQVSRTTTDEKSPLKRSRPGSNVLEVEEANKALNALYMSDLSSQDDSPSLPLKKRHKKSRNKPRPAHEERSPKVATRETEAVTLKQRKRRRLSTKQKLYPDQKGAYLLTPPGKGGTLNGVNGAQMSTSATNGHTSNVATSLETEAESLKTKQILSPNQQDTSLAKPPSNDETLNRAQVPTNVDDAEASTVSTLDAVTSKKQKKCRPNTKHSPSSGHQDVSLHTSRKNKIVSGVRLPSKAAKERQKPPFRHVLLGNACTSPSTENDSVTEFMHPQYCPDTRTDGVLSAVEMEFAWLCEESLHCLEGDTVSWGFVYEHASNALQAELRNGMNSVPAEVAEHFRLKRECVRSRLTMGYRRLGMAKTIAFHRLALRQGITVEKLRSRMKKNASPPKKSSKKASSADLPLKKRTHQVKPTITGERKKQSAEVFKPPTMSSSKILTEIEEELAWLVEESIMQNIFDDIDHDYVLKHASPTLRKAMDGLSRRWLPRLVRLHTEKVKIEFELQRFYIRNRLYSGYRRPETKAVLPVGRVTNSEYKEQQSHRKA